MPPHGGQAPVAEDEQPVTEHVESQPEEGNHHHWLGLVNAGAVAVQGAVGGKRRQAKADDVHEHRGLLVHIGRQLQVIE